MLERLLREPLARLLVPAARAASRLGLTPNALTLIGTAIVAAGGLFIAIGELALGGWLLLGGVVFDIFDGAVARTSGTGGARGAFLDSTTDRISDGLVFGALAWQFAGSSSLGLALALSAGLLAFLTSYIRARAEALGMECKVGIAERPERMALVISGLILNLLVGALAVLVALAFMTVVQRFVHVWNQTHAPRHP